MITVRYKRLKFILYFLKSNLYSGMVNENCELEELEI